MKKRSRLALVGVWALAGLTGCFSSIHQVSRVQTVASYRTATPHELAESLRGRDEALHTLNVSVLLTASEGGAKEGKVKTFTSFRGYISVQKPDFIRVIMQLPVIGSRALDMVSDGKTFKLLMASAHGTRAITGSDTVEQPSKNALENIRPAVILDSLLVRSLGPDEYASVTQGTRVLEPAHGHRAEVDEPSYEFEIDKVTGDHLFREERLIHISRVTLLPYEQDIFGPQGQVVTTAVYENYAPVGDVPFPRLITITRPLDEVTLKIEVTKATINQEFPPDQFQLTIPAGMKVERLP